MNSVKRKTYLIDKSFQLGFMKKYLFIIFLTVVFCFAIVALYYFKISLMGTKKLDQNIIIKSRSNKTKDGYKIYEYDKEQIKIYEKIDKDGKKTFYCLNPYSNTDYKIGDMVYNVNEKDLIPGFVADEKITKLFYIVFFPLLWTSLAIMCIIAIYTIFFSHRIAGPIYRIRVSLDRMLAGDYEFKIKVRKNDFYGNIADKLEQLRLKIKTSSTGTIPREKIEKVKQLLVEKKDNQAILEEIDNILK